jgi:transposase
MDLSNLLLHLRDNPSDRAVARDTGLNRRTVQTYRIWATAQQLLTDPLPSRTTIQAARAATFPTTPPPQNVSTVEPYRDLVVAWRAQGVDVMAIWQRLQEHGFTGHYSSVHRFVRTLEPSLPDATVRVERHPGEEAQVDFGAAGMLLDPGTNTLRNAWVFVMVLSWSRHMFVAFTFSQSVAAWIDLHRRAFAFFGGVPHRVVIDNLKAGITKAAWDDPQIQQTYRECAAHYGFRITPCRPATPEHKGKVERGVQYVTRNFLAGRSPTPLPQADAEVRTWCLTTAGLRVHGTTQAVPLDRFRDTEQAALTPLPATAYDLGVWAQLTVARDCYLVFERAYYSVPFRLIGQRVQVRGGSQTVEIYTSDYQVVATHRRASQPGERVTHLDHLPPYKLPGLLRTREGCVVEAARVGCATTEVVQQWLADPVVDRLLAVGRLLRLADRFGASRLEAACARALHFEAATWRSIEQILTQGLDQAAVAELLPTPAAQQFVRSAEELVGSLTGGVTWN